MNSSITTYECGYTTQINKLLAYLESVLVGLILSLKVYLLKQKYKISKTINSFTIIVHATRGQG